MNPKFKINQDSAFINHVSKQIIKYKENNGYNSGLNNVIEGVVRNLKKVTPTNKKLTVAEACYLSLDLHGLVIFHLNSKGITDVTIINKSHINKIKIGHLLSTNLTIILKDHIVSSFNKRIKVQIILPHDKNSFLYQNAKNLAPILDKEQYSFDK